MVNSRNLSTWPGSAPSEDPDTYGRNLKLTRQHDDLELEMIIENVTTDILKEEEEEEEEEDIVSSGLDYV